MGNRDLLAIACMIGILMENSSEGSNSMVKTSSDLPVERAPHLPTEHLQGIVERVTYHAEFHRKTSLRTSQQLLLVLLLLDGHA